MTSYEKRCLVAETAKSYLGVTEGTSLHATLVNIYNNINPLPVGYKLKTTDPWCAAFVSVVFRVCNINFPYECSCERMRVLAEKAGSFVEEDWYSPSIGDAILYDWQDNGVGDNKGYPDHVGIVVKLNEKNFVVVEGNCGNKVAERTLEYDGKYIRGFIIPNYTTDGDEDEPYIKWAKSHGFNYDGHWDDYFDMSYRELFKFIYSVLKK